VSKIQTVSLKKLLRNIAQFAHNKAVWRMTGVAAGVVLIAAFFRVFYKNDIEGKTFYLLVWVILGYTAFHYRDHSRWKDHARGLILGLATFQFLMIFHNTAKTLIYPQEWDFLCFYMQGLLGKYHLPFYDPSSFDIVLNSYTPPINYTSSFRSEILNVGMLSPPITMLYFTPLTMFDYFTAQALVSFLIICSIFICVYLANSLVPKEIKSVYSALFIFIILMLIPGAHTTIVYGQSNFFILMFILLMIRNIRNSSAGAYLALSMVFKPLTAFLILYFVINRNWKALFSFILMTMVLLGLTIGIWGMDNILSFIQSPPTRRLPQSLYIQEINQSFVALLNRNLLPAGFTSQQVMGLFLAGSAVFVTASVYSSMKVFRINPFLALVPFVLTMLMIYPSSLNHYMIYLFPLFIHIAFIRREDILFWLLVIIGVSFLHSATFFAYFTFWLLSVSAGIAINGQSVFPAFRAPFMSTLSQIKLMKSQ